MIPKRSRYRFSVVCEDGDAAFLGNRPRTAVPPRPDDLTHAVAEGDRLDLLAHRYLGDARLWWVIADANDIFWPMDLETGAVLRIPGYRRVHMDILD